MEFIWFIWFVWIHLAQSEDGSKWLRETRPRRSAHATHCCSGILSATAEAIGFWTLCLLPPFSFTWKLILRSAQDLLAVIRDTSFGCLSSHPWPFKQGTSKPRNFIAVQHLQVSKRFLAFPYRKEGRVLCQGISIHICTYLSVYLSVCLSVYLPILSSQIPSISYPILFFHSTHIDTRYTLWWYTWIDWCVCI